MKLRSLTLSNVRKFAGQTATIRDIGDGVSVVAEANEFGKSTFFDALHALFFVKYGAATREVKALQPRAGGPVRVQVEVELPKGRYTIEKSFLSQKRARVRDAAGSVIALDDEAENWIAGLMGTGLDGPAGLLWVRQGITALEPAASTGTEKDKLLGARRDLLSSVAGEIDMVTGGRRMDRVIETAFQGWSRLATTKGPKTGGPWKQAQLEAAALAERHTELDAACTALAQALAARREVARRLATLDAPGVKEGLEQEERHARDALATAQAHADKLEQAKGHAALKRMEAKSGQDKLDALLAAAQTFEHAQERFDETYEELARARAQRGEVQDTYATVQKILDAAVARAAAARKAVEALRQDALRRHAQDRCDGLKARLVQVEEKRSALEHAQAALETLTVTSAALARIESAQTTLTTAQAEAQAGAVQIEVNYTGSNRITAQGDVIDSGAHRVATRQVYELPGLGRMTIDPGAAATDMAAVMAAQTALDRALHAVGAADLDTARRAATQRREVEAEIALLDNILSTIAPQGVASIRSGYAKAEAARDALKAVVTPEQTDPTMLEHLMHEAQKAETDARAHHGEWRDALDAARAREARAQALTEAAQQGRETAAAAYGDAATFDARKAQAAREHSTADAAASDAQTAVEQLVAQAPDLATAQADLARAHSAAQNARQERAQLTEQHAALSATIRARAEDGIEEKRDEAAGALASARALAAQFAHEAAGYALLLETLRAKRGAAQDAYFGPVQQELAPLLALLHEGAALSFDPTSLLPSGLARGGADEAVERLSGGTQEQIAILTRLAFARLFARQGKPMPVILDDALVYSDDTRIMAMFTALHRVAVDQQVIVFTCRQMAFAGLGGTRPVVEVVQDV